MAERKDTDSLLMDWLYEPDQQEPKEEVSAHQGDLDSYRRVREAFRELPEEEPPPALTAILMHEAARRAPASRPRAVTAHDDEERGFFAWLGRIFGAMVAHPAATAAATLVLVAGIAGSLYVRGQTASDPMAESAAPAPAAVAEGEGSVASVETELTRDEAAAAEPMPDDDLRLRYDNGHTVTLADEELDGVLEQQQDKAEKKATSEKVKLASKPDPVATRQQAPARKSASKAPEVQANAVTGADQLIDLDDADATSTVQKTGRSAARDERPATAPPSPPPPAQAPAGGAPGAAESDGDDGAESVDTWARDKHAQLEGQARRDECVAAARTANDIRERSPRYYDQHVAGSKAYERCSSTIVAEQKRRAARRARDSEKSGEQQPAAEPSGD